MLLIISASFASTTFCLFIIYSVRSKWTNTQRQDSQVGPIGFYIKFHVCRICKFRSTNITWWFWVWNNFWLFKMMWQFLCTRNGVKTCNPIARQRTLVNEGETRRLYLTWILGNCEKSLVCKDICVLWISLRDRDIWLLFSLK